MTTEVALWVLAEILAAICIVEMVKRAYRRFGRWMRPMTVTHGGNLLQPRYTDLTRRNDFAMCALSAMQLDADCSPEQAYQAAETAFCIADLMVRTGRDRTDKWHAWSGAEEWYQQRRERDAQREKSTINPQTVQ